MFARISVVLFFAMMALPLLAAATAITRRDDPMPASQCNTSDLQCCNSTAEATPGLTGLLQGLLGVVLGPITGLIGLTCSPLDILGIGGTSCSQQPVCCTGNSFSGGLISLGCIPININL